MKFDLKNSKKQVAVFASVVYFIQGAIGISSIAVPVYFRSRGWSVADITVISSISSLPWIFKIAYGFLSDCFPLFRHRRKSYLFLYLFLSVAGWCAFAFWGKTQMEVVLALWIANLGFAGTDVITDGLIVENSEGDWGRVYQGLAWGFRSLGSVITGILGGWLVLHHTPQSIFLMTACLPLLAILPLVLFHETPSAHVPSFSEWGEKIQLVLKFCLVRKHLIFMLFFALSSSSVLFGTPFFFHMREKLFFADDYLGFLISLGWAGAALGSMAFLRWMRHIPMRGLLYAVIILNVLNILSTYAVRDVFSAALLVFLGGVAGGITLLPLMSESANSTSGSGVEGTLFALLMGFYNLAQIAWGFLGGKLLLVMGLWGLIALAAMFQLSAVFLISRMHAGTRTS